MLADPSDVVEAGLDMYLSPAYTTDSFQFEIVAYAWRSFCTYAIKVQAVLQIKILYIRAQKEIHV